MKKFFSSPKILVLALATLTFFSSCKKSESDRPGELTVHVGLKSDYSTSIQGAVVSVTAPDGRKLAALTTSSNGSCTLENLQPGLYSINVIAKNFKADSIGTWVHSGETSDIWIYLSPCDVPTVTTDQPTDMTENTVAVGGKIVSDEGSPVSEWGICWNLTNQNPTIEDNKITAATSESSFTTTLANLNPYTTISIRAFATNSKGTGYGETVSCTTLDKEVIIADRYFFDYLLVEFDLKNGNNDGKIQASEISEVNYLKISDKRIASLEGIQYFSHLSSLSCIGTAVSALDLSEFSQLKNIDCSDNPELISVNLNGLPELASVDCRNSPKLSSLNLENCTKLESLNCNYCNLKSVDLNTESLRTLYCDDNPELDALNLESCIKLETLNCTGCNLSLLNLGKHDALAYINCNGNKNLKSVSIKSCRSLTTFEAGMCDLNGTLDLSKYSNLKTVYCENNPNLNRLDVSGCLQLTDIAALETGITEVLVSEGQKTDQPGWDFPDATVFTIVRPQ